VAANSLFDYADLDLEHDLLPNFLNVLSRRFARQDIPLGSRRRAKSSLR
jgi:hypothetical protein